MKSLSGQETAVNEDDEQIAVLVIACNRPEAIKIHLKQLIEKRAMLGKVDKFPIVVSQDCAHAETAAMIESFADSLHAFVKQPDQSRINLNGAAPNLEGYFRISRHYKFALSQIFVKFKFNSVIITEDDLTIAVDFFGYFEAMKTVLTRDSVNLFCVSAWNDNGNKDAIDNSSPGKACQGTKFFYFFCKSLNIFYFKFKTKI